MPQNATGIERILAQAGEQGLLPVMGGGREDRDGYRLGVRRRAESGRGSFEDRREALEFTVDLVAATGLVGLSAKVVGSPPKGSKGDRQVSGGGAGHPAAAAFPFGVLILLTR